MVEFKKSNEAKDYKERFEFRLTTSAGDIICQRYFKINNFNPLCTRSLELVDTIRYCAKVINRDLLDKTHVYLDIFTPQIFDSVEQMKEYLSVPSHAARIAPGEGIVVRGSEVDYYMDDKGQVQECKFKFDDGELSGKLADEDISEYKFAFMIDGKEVCSTIWTGLYPKYVRNSIDLTNKRGKVDKEEVSQLTFEQYLLYKLVEGRKDLVWGLIKEICTTCSSEDDYYTTTLDYGEKQYHNVLKKSSHK